MPYHHSVCENLKMNLAGYESLEPLGGTSHTGMSWNWPLPSSSQKFKMMYVISSTRIHKAALMPVRLGTSIK